MGENHVFLIDRVGKTQSRARSLTVWWVGWFMFTLGSCLYIHHSMHATRTRTRTRIRTHTCTRTCACARACAHNYDIFNVQAQAWA